MLRTFNGKTSVNTRRLLLIIAFAIIMLIMTNMCLATPSVSTHSEPVVVSHPMKKRIETNLTKKTEHHLQNRTEMQANNTFHIPFHIFQIGHHKCGTTFLFNLFKSNHIPSVHDSSYFHKSERRTPLKSTNTTLYNNKSNDIPSVHDSLYFHKSERRTPLKSTMTRLYNNNKSVLETLANEYMFYADYGIQLYTKDNETIPWYTILNTQYQNAKYILNIRNVNHWLKSRYTHISAKGGFLIDNWRHDNGSIDGDMLMLKEWKQQWYEHICGVLEYFRVNGIRNNLLLFDIENDSVNKLKRFFMKFNVLFEDKHLSPERMGNTLSLSHKSENREMMITQQLEKWHNIAVKYSEFNFGEEDDDWNNEYTRIKRICDI